jgi:uncharacterized protein YjaZ
MTTGVWDEFGRFFTIYGVRNPKSFGASDKYRNVRVFTIFGEPLQSITQIPDLQLFAFRPRPQNILSGKDQAKLKTDFRVLYGKQYKEEEKNEKNAVQEEVRLKKKAIRDEFLNNFYLPMRRKYEADMDKYIKLWPVKDSDMTDKEEVVTHVYNYCDLLETKRIER